MSKLPMIYRKSMRTYFYVLGIIAATVLVIQIIGLLFSAMGGGLGDALPKFATNFANSFIPVSFALLYLYYLIVPYREFKLGLQNGQTRRQIWISQILGIITITIVGWLLFLIISGPHPMTIKSSLGTLLGFFNGVMTTYAIGSGFALLSRKWKVIVGIAGPTILAIIMVQLAKVMVSYWHPSTATLQNLASIFNSPASWVFLALIWLALMAGLSYCFTMHQQLRRD